MPAKKKKLTKEDVRTIIRYGKTDLLRKAVVENLVDIPSDFLDLDIDGNSALQIAIIHGQIEMLQLLVAGIDGLEIDPSIANASRKAFMPEGLEDVAAAATTVFTLGVPVISPLISSSVRSANTIEGKTAIDLARERLSSEQQRFALDILQVAAMSAGKIKDREMSRIAGMKIPQSILPQENFVFHLGDEKGFEGSYFERGGDPDKLYLEVKQEVEKLRARENAKLDQRKQREQEFFTKAKDGTLTEDYVRQFVKDGFSINCKDANGASALELAAKAGKLDVVKILASGVSQDAADQNSKLLHVRFSDDLVEAMEICAQDRLKPRDVRAIYQQIYNFLDTLEERPPSPAPVRPLSAAPARGAGVAIPNPISVMG